MVGGRPTAVTVLENHIPNSLTLLSSRSRGGAEGRTLLEGGDVPNAAIAFENAHYREPNNVDYDLALQQVIGLLTDHLEDEQ